MFLISINSSIEEIVKVLSRYPLNWFTVLKTRRFELIATKYVVAECQGSPPQIPSPIYGCMEFTPFYILVICFPEIQLLSCLVHLSLPGGLFARSFPTKILYVFFFLFCYFYYYYYYFPVCKNTVSHRPLYISHISYQLYHHDFHVKF
jgi:hypothetical protein